MRADRRVPQIEQHGPARCRGTAATARADIRFAAPAEIHTDMKAETGDAAG
jgi:hypothetical protein